MCDPGHTASQSLQSWVCAESVRSAMVGVALAAGIRAEEVAVVGVALAAGIRAEEVAVVGVALAAGIRGKPGEVYWC